MMHPTMRLNTILRALLTAAAVCLGSLMGRAATVEVSGYLYGTHNWTSDNDYVLTGFTYVMGNAVLNIEPGTVIQGAPGAGGGGNDFGCLFVCQNGRINALGTPNSPVIFTSTEDDVTDAEDLIFPTRGLWGGVVLLGNALLNNPASTTNAQPFDVYEGLPDTVVTNEVGEVTYLHRFGGTDDADSSGILRYVSIRHAGKKLTTDKEVNGLSLGAVGSGTTVEYVEAYCTADDGFEFFGGSVNTKHLVSAFNDDDAFDTDEGYHGKNQFWFAIQEPGTRDEGSEQNGQPNSPDVLVEGALPLSNYEVYNATLIGAGTTGSGNDALNIRRCNFGKVIDGRCTEFQGEGFWIDATTAREVANIQWWAPAGGTGPAYGTAYAPAELNTLPDPELGGISREPGLLALDPIPAPAGPAYTVARRTPTDAFYETTDHVGAFGTENWMQDWTALGAEAFLRVTPIRSTGPVESGGPTGGLVSASLADGKLVLTWTAEGTLQVAEAIDGTYEDVPGAASPHEVTPSSAQRFYRLR